MTPGIGDALDRDALTVAMQNDEFRYAMEGHGGIPGHVVLSEGLLARGVVFTRLATLAVTVYDDFGGGNDPAPEHDHGALVVDGVPIRWHIDLHAPDLIHAPRDRTDPVQTVRVLRIMLDAEW